jgi:hypothetical protein
MSLRLLVQPSDQRARVGERMHFELEVTLARPMAELVLGIHVFDSYGNWAFGTNSDLLRQPLANMPPGCYRVSFTLSADLPTGSYTAGFSAAERSGVAEQRLVWYDRLAMFDVVPAVTTPFAGYSYLHPLLTVEPVASAAAPAT